MRTSKISRKTAETDITLSLNIDGSGKTNIKTGCGFLDHMLTLFASHGKLDLEVSCSGDTFVDDHHTVEDIGIVLGKAFSQAVGDKKGINRFANTILPMDEALILSAVDISGRSFLGYELQIPTQKAGNFDTELVREFWQAFVSNFPCSLHIRQLAGINSHHIIEGAFKSVARSVRQAIAKDELLSDQIPSTKGVL